MNKFATGLLLSALCFVAVSSRAQTDDPPPRVSHGSALLTTGIVSTTVGAVSITSAVPLMIAAAVMTMHPPEQCPSNGCPPRTNAFFIGGVVAIAVGVVGLAFGIPAIVVGRQQARARVSLLADGLSVHF